VAVVLAAFTAVATLAVAEMGTASASTVNGIATTALPSNDTYLASGGSNTDFTVTLPSGAVCTGDTAHDGYHVWSYLVKQSQSIAATTFSAATGPSQGFGLYESDLNYYGPVNTAQTTGQIIGIPNDFQWGAGVAGGSFTAADLLYTGGTSGIWEAGLACANSSGVLTDNWNTEVTFTQSGSDPNGFTWSAVPGPSGSTLAAITSADATTFTEGTLSTFTPTATGSPAPTITGTGPLPTGVTFTGGSLTGTPTESGTFPITFTATNGIGDPAVQSFTLTVASSGVAPTITSADATSFTEGTLSTFTPTATGSPAPTITETGPLPTGVTFTGGSLTGTPTESGTFPITFTATNGVLPNAVQSFTLTVASSGVAPTITLRRSTGLIGHFSESVAGAGWFGDTTVTLFECARRTFKASLCDSANQVAVSVKTGKHAGTFDDAHITLVVGIIDAHGNTCGLDRSKKCYIVAVGNSGDSATSVVLGFRIPSVSARKTSDVPGGYVDRIKADSFPIGHTVVARECSHAKLVPAAIDSRCDAATAISGTVGRGGRVYFTSPGVDLLVGSAYSDPSGHDCRLGHRCDIVVTDSDNPAIALSVTVHFAPENATKTAGLN
jgi:hypothetical protein